MEMMHEFHTAVNIISITVLTIKLAVAFTFIACFSLRILLIMVALKTSHLAGSIFDMLLSLNSPKDMSAWAPFMLE